MLSFFEIQIQYFQADMKNLFPMIKSTFKNISLLVVLIFKTNILLKKKVYSRPALVIGFSENNFLQLQPQYAKNL